MAVRVEFAVMVNEHVREVHPAALPVPVQLRNVEPGDGLPVQGPIDVLGA